MTKAIDKLSPRTLILDGEVAVFDERLVSRFHLFGDSSPDALVAAGLDGGPAPPVRRS